MNIESQIGSELLTIQIPVNSKRSKKLGISPITEIYYAIPKIILNSIPISL